jgi:hypothetical protein
MIKQMQDNRNQLQQLHDATKGLNIQLEEGKLQHQKNVEVLVRQQRKARMYNVKAACHRLLFRSEHSLDSKMLHMEWCKLIKHSDNFTFTLPVHWFPLTLHSG